MKEIYTGLESSGKSLKLAMQASEIAHRNGKWLRSQQKYLELYGQGAFEKKFGRLKPLGRQLWSNFKFSEQFEDFYHNELGLPQIKYWKNLEDLLHIEDADVFIDEIGSYFDSRNWKDLSVDVRRWLTQAAKIGVEIYGTAQDFAQVDISFRRLVNNLYHITKLIGSRRPSPTKPPVARVWGICLVTELDPNGYDETKKKFKYSMIQLPSFFLIAREYCDMFDTTQRIVKSKTAPLRHVVYTCEEPDCEFHKTAHI